MIVNEILEKSSFFEIHLEIFKADILRVGRKNLHHSNGNFEINKITILFQKSYLITSISSFINYGIESGDVKLRPLIMYKSSYFKPPLPKGSSIGPELQVD